MNIFALKKGDNVIEKITQYIKSNNIKSGLVVALGAIEYADLLSYNLQTKEYVEKHFDGPLEVASMQAIIGKDPEGMPHIHPHIVISGHDFKAYGGHLKEALVGATLEVVILESDQDVQRYADSHIGLNLIR